ncbi:MAG: chemotaxis protein CheB [Actinomycetes bacterium]
MPVVDPGPAPSGGSDRGRDGRGLVGPVRVLLACATATRAQVLRSVVDDRWLRVVATTAAPAGLEAAVRSYVPGVVLLDLALGEAGITAVEAVMARCPTPILAVRPVTLPPSTVGAGGVRGPMLHGRSLGEWSQLAAAALSAGAVGVLGVDLDHRGSPVEAPAGLRRTLLAASRVRTITHPRGRLRGLRTQAGEPAGLLVVVGASTGGPQALAAVLSRLPPDLPAGVLVVQHMADGFVESLAGWLDGVCRLPVRLAVDGERLRVGQVLLAPARRNLRVRPGARVVLVPAPVGQFHVPGIDVTFADIAAIYGQRAVGVLLTGMGRDGATGLLALRRAGAATIAQDEASSVVWGMPGAAVGLGAAQAELGVGQIGAAVVAAVADAAVGAHR